MPIKLKPIPSFNHERFLSKIKIDNVSGCWIWKASISNGYGEMYIGGGNYRSHRLAWSLFKGDPTEGLVLDHICKNRACCNPDHLREVSFLTNVTENSNSIAARNKEKTKCPNGHMYDKAIKYLNGGATTYHRGCAVCRKIAWQKGNDKRRMKLLASRSGDYFKNKEGI